MDHLLDNCNSYLQQQVALAPYLSSTTFSLISAPHPAPTFFFFNNESQGQHFFSKNNISSLIS